MSNLTIELSCFDAFVCPNPERPWKPFNTQTYLEMDGDFTDYIERLNAKDHGKDWYPEKDGSGDFSLRNMFAQIYAQEHFQRSKCREALTGLIPAC